MLPDSEIFRPVRIVLIRSREYFVVKNHASTQLLLLDFIVTKCPKVFPGKGR